MRIIFSLMLLSYSLHAQVYYTPLVPKEGIFYSGGWGINQEGEFMNNFWSDDPSGMWYQDTSKSFIEISCGDWSCIGIKSDSTLWFWGYDENGCGGQGSTADNDVIRPIQIGTDTTWAKCAVGNGTGDFCFAIKGNGTLWSWGQGSNYQTGQGSTTNLGTPTQVGSATGWTHISAGGAWAGGIESGKLMTWGSNASGKTGQGVTTGTTNIPTQVGVATNWVYMSSGNLHGHAINSSGELWAWGEGNNGRLGTGSNTDRLSPFQCGTDTDWASVASGLLQTFAIKTNGTLYSTGDHGRGATCQGTFTGSTNTFTQIGTDTDWAFVKLATGSNAEFNSHSFVFKTNGHVYSCGENSMGQIAQPETTIQSNTLSRVGDIANAKTIGLCSAGVFIIRRN